MLRLTIPRLALTCLVALCAAPGGTARAQTPDCTFAEIGSGRIAAVRDGNTLLLDDGREVRLAGIAAPAAKSPPGAAAHQQLATFATGRDASLTAASAPPDRYGRLVAFATVGGHMLQMQMLTSGFAMVASRIGDADCARALRTAEREARTARRGLWADGGFRLQSAGNPAEIIGNAGQMALVRGKVLSVRESGATIYVNFGRRWSEDFTVTILKRNRRLFSTAGIVPKSLEGRVIEVRGFVERRGGPLIDVSRPEQIEIVD